MLDEQRPNVAIGRAEDNDLVIKGNLISRLHARIEINRNKFVLIDQSTNGTFVQAEDGEESFVRRDSLQIKGEGMIGLGRLPERESPQTIRFDCEEAELGAGVRRWRHPRLYRDPAPFHRQALLDLVELRRISAGTRAPYSFRYVAHVGGFLAPGVGHPPPAAPASSRR